MPEKIRTILKQAAAFQYLQAEEIERIAQFSTIQRLDEGRCLFKEGEHAADLWVVASGEIALRFELPARQSTEAQSISTLSETGILGWSSLIPPYRYKLSGYCASEPCEVIRINGEELVAYLKNNPELGYRVLSAMIRVVGNRFEHLQATAETRSPL
ncbi:MAG: cyclic nucleotide-binding domain-containing protein [Desulfobacteraceae bacterium]|nr:cyclic nucleotide-binding domain-containing protein [Desulfobacteraceae bacterium]MCF8095809.1 cyclic nucleotide-binding domain-containing protein [Desulfobacteraceae bacterium]